MCSRGTALNGDPGKPPMAADHPLSHRHGGGGVPAGKCALTAESVAVQTFGTWWQLSGSVLA